MAANFDMRKGRVKVEWFRGARTNVCYNALDRWVEAGRGQQVLAPWSQPCASVATSLAIISELHAPWPVYARCCKSEDENDWTQPADD